MNALLSIKPEFAEKILSGQKEYEFRRTSFRDASKVEVVYLYASSPVQKIVGAFTIGDVIGDTPEELWQQFGNQSGISDKARFMKYYEGADDGYAYKINRSHKLETALDPRDYVEEFVPPTSFHYLNGELLNKLQERVTPHLRPANATVLAQYSSD